MKKKLKDFYVYKVVNLKFLSLCGFCTLDASRIKTAQSFYMVDGN